MKRVRRILSFVLLFASGYGFAQSYTIKTVPNMKVINNTYVSNPDNIISEATVSQINQQLAALEQQTTSQVAVVLLNSIGEEAGFNFAQNLFEEWGIGRANKDNGLLILFIKDQRKIRLHTGLGLEGMLPDAICKRIETQQMVPHFKNGDFDAGILAGVAEVNKILTDPQYAKEINEDDSDEPLAEGAEQAGLSLIAIVAWLVIGLIIYFFKRKSGFSDSPNTVYDAPSSKISSGSWWWWHYAFPIFTLIALAFTTDWLSYVIGAYAFFDVLGLVRYGRIAGEASTWLKKKEYHAVHYFLSQQKNGLLAMAIFFPFPFVLVWRHLKKKIESVRIIPRDCKNCGKTCARLDETKEDEYLAAASQLEEQLKSVDYDVWKCNVCGEVSIEAYLNEKTPYSECPNCKTHAFYVVSSTTKVAATTSHDGTREVVKSCKFCNHRQVDLETIPQIETSSSSSGSSSSDSGGSFGGGDSGGGGASSSW